MAAWLSPNGADSLERSEQSTGGAHQHPACSSQLREAPPGPGHGEGVEQAERLSDRRRTSLSLHRAAYLLHDSPALRKPANGSRPAIVTSIASRASITPDSAERLIHVALS